MFDQMFFHHKWNEAWLFVIKMQICNKDTNYLMAKQLKTYDLRSLEAIGKSQNLAEL